MGCGNQSSLAKSSGGIIVVSSSMNHRTPKSSIHLASQLQIKDNIILENIRENSENKTSEDQNGELGSLIRVERKDEIVELSKIPFVDQDVNRHCTVRLRSPTEVANRVQNLHPSQGFNFDFLNESSAVTNKIKKLHAEIDNDLDSIKIE